MKPLFGSTPRRAKEPHMRWRIWSHKDICGKPFLLAGKPIELETHRVGRRTLPCLYQWPALGLECPHCERARRTSCWVPLVACFAPWKRVIAMAGETLAKSVDTLPKRCVVTGKMALMLKPTLMLVKDTDPLSLAIMSGAEREMEGDPGDITRWLLHYWQWPELSKAFGEVYRESLRRRAQRERAEVSALDVLSDAG